MRFVDILDDYHVPYRTAGHHHCREGWVQFDCPFCGAGSGSFHAGFNLADKYINCWRCGSLSTFDVLRELIGVAPGKAAALAKGIEGEIIQKRPERHRLAIPKGVGPLGPAHLDYLATRGIVVDSVAGLWGLQGIGIAKRLSWRIFIPIKYRGETVSWTTRAIGKASARYVSARADEEAIAHKTLLYGEDLAGHSIVVVEGPLDVWKIGPGAVATFGIDYSRAQLAKIAKHPRRTICFDNESKAQAKAKELANALSVLPGETYLMRLDAKDAGEASGKEIRQLRHHALGGGA